MAGDKKRLGSIKPELEEQLLSISPRQTDGRLAGENVAERLTLLDVLAIHDDHVGDAPLGHNGARRGVDRAKCDLVTELGRYALGTFQVLRQAPSQIG